MLSKPTSDDKEYEKGWFNRISNATFEMGSTFKSFTLAMGLDAGKINLNSVVDASAPTHGRLHHQGFKGKNRPLSTTEVFQYSSNIGTAAVADMVGVEGHQQFLTKLGLLSKMETELPGVAVPTQPRVWKKINSVTISFGHGGEAVGSGLPPCALLSPGYQEYQRSRCPSLLRMLSKIC